MTSYVSLQRQKFEIILTLKGLELDFLLLKCKKNLIFLRLIEVSTEKSSEKVWNNNQPTHPPTNQPTSNDVQGTVY